MIILNNLPDTNLYISGNYITIANNNAVSLNFVETDTSCPSTILLSPLNFSGELTNLTGVIIESVLDCTPDPTITNTESYLYEVINSKVVFERVDKTSNITFIDVTSKSTYSHRHNIPVTNTTWLQNPTIVASNLGVILIEKYNENTLVWDVVGSMPLNGTFTYYTNLAEDEIINCQFRSRYIIRERRNCGGTSPIIFESLGEEFDLLLKYYEEENLYVKEVLINDQSKFNLCDTDPIDYLSVEVEKPFEVVYDSYNIDYVYQYLDSSSSLGLTPISTLTYNQFNRSAQGIISDLDPRQETTLVTVEFIGCQNQFTNGLLIVNSSCSGLTPNQGDFNCNDFSQDFYVNCSNNVEASIVTESKQLLIEGVRPNIVQPIVQEDCTYCVLIEDNTIIENSCLKGLVQYQYKTSLNGEWCDFNKSTIKEVTPLDSFNYCFCEAGTVYIRNKYKYIEQHSCTCKNEDHDHNDILFETDWYEYTHEVLEYKPKIEATIIEDDGCCTILEYQNQDQQFIDVVPNKLELNDYSCSNKDPRVLPSITYIFELHDQTNNIWDIVDTQIIKISQLDYDVSLPIITSSIILNKYKYSIDKSVLEQGGYRVRYILSNCCTQDEEVVYLNLCDSLTIRRECDIIPIDSDEECSCLNYVLNNYSFVDTYTIQIYNTGLETIVDTITVEPNTEMTYTFLEDGIYTFTITNDNGLSTVGKYTNPYVIPIFIFCKINTCYTNIVKDVLCSYNADCDCEDLDLVKDRFRLNKVMALYQTFMRFIEKEYYLMSRYNIIDLESRLASFARANKIYAQLLKFCEPCNNGEKTNCCS